VGGISQLDHSLSSRSPSILDLVQPHEHPVNTPINNPQQDHDPVDSSQVSITSGQTDIISPPDTVCNTPSNATGNAHPLPSVNIQPTDTSGETRYATNQQTFFHVQSTVNIWDASL
jgi:hypothetical protein